MYTRVHQCTSVYTSVHPCTPLYTRVDGCTPVWSRVTGVYTDENPCEPGCAAPEHTVSMITSSCTAVWTPVSKVSTPHGSTRNHTPATPNEPHAATRPFTRPVTQMSHPTALARFLSILSIFVLNAGPQYWRHLLQSASQGHVDVDDVSG